MKAQPFIVAEISKNWVRVKDGTWHEVPGSPIRTVLLAELFELAINTNRGRGYALHSFQLHRLMVTADEMNETIVAVFQKM